MAIARPFTWVVSFTVDPLWVQDGFSLTDERAYEMLSSELSHAHGDEFSARVLNAPSALQIARIQGYGPKHPEAKNQIQSLRAACPDDGKVWNALIAARDLLDSVAFVGKEGDTARPLAMIEEALNLMTPRQGEDAECEAF